MIGATLVSQSQGEDESAPEGVEIKPLDLPSSLAILRQHVVRRPAGPARIPSAAHTLRERTNCKPWDAKATVRALIDAGDIRALGTNGDVELVEVVVPPEPVVPRDIQPDELPPIDDEAEEDEEEEEDDSEPDSEEEPDISLVQREERFPTPTQEGVVEEAWREYREARDRKKEKEMLTSAPKTRRAKKSSGRKPTTPSVQPEKLPHVQSDGFIYKGRGIYGNFWLIGKLKGETTATIRKIASFGPVKSVQAINERGKEETCYSVADIERNMKVFERQKRKKDK